MLRYLRHSRGEPALRVRVLALLVLLGLVMLSAPIVLIPVARWVFGLIL